MKTLNRMSRMAAAAGMSVLAAGALCFPLSAGTTDKCGSAASQTLLKQRREIMAQREKMLAAARAEDASLEKLVAEMNRAPEAKKVDLEAAILTKLVAQHHKMLGEWETMHARMLQFRKERSSASRSALNTVPNSHTATAQK